MPYSISELKGKIFQGSTPMSLEWEKAHLLRADQLVADGERRVGEQATHINHMLDSGHDVAEAQGRLTALRATLAKWHVHRAEIRQHINRIEAGTM
jgi:hypothetical protein